MNTVFKRFLGLLLCFVLLFGVVACGNSEPEETTEPDPMIVGAQEGMPASEVATYFVEALAMGKFDEAVLFTEASVENSFVVGEDLKWYLPRSSFSDIQRLGFNSFRSKVTGSEAEGFGEFVVTLYDAAEGVAAPAEKSFTVQCVLSNSNVWVVTAPEFYCKDFSFRTAGGDTRVYLDGVFVPSILCSDEDAGPEGLCRDYTIPFIGKNNVEVELRNNNYTYKQEITPNSENNISAAVTVLKPVEEPDKCFSFIKDTWNALCAKYLVGDIASCVSDYVAQDASYDLCNMVWDGFEAIHVGDSSQGGIKNENYKLTVCKASDKGKTYWLSDRHIMCYFDYELTWYYNLGKANQSTHQNSSIILCVEDGVYKFYAFTDPGLFKEANNYSNEW